MYTSLVPACIMDNTYDNIYFYWSYSTCDIRSDVACIVIVGMSASNTLNTWRMTLSTFLLQQCSTYLL